jgi:hypothetical protein
MKAQINKLCEQCQPFEKKVIPVIAVATALPGIVVALVVVLRFLGKV